MDFPKKNKKEKLKKYLWVKNEVWIYEQKLWKKVKKYQKFFAYIPWVLCVCVWNSLAMNAAHKNSDIDLFIITKKKRIWTVRILFTLLLNIVGERKTAKKHAWKFCLSFFVTENALNLKKIAIKNDIYLAYWIQTLKPIINRKQTFEKFQAKNSLPVPSTYIQVFGTGRLEKKKNIIWDLLETLLKKIFLPRTQKSFQKLWKPFWVIISDDILKFHDKDKRKEIRDNITSL